MTMLIERDETSCRPKRVPVLIPSVWRTGYLTAGAQHPVEKAFRLFLGLRGAF
jgi:hypothetical protein